MATYKVVDADQLNADMSSVADSIRTKGGTTDALAWPDGYKTAIDSIPAGGGAPSLQSKSVTYTANGTATIAPDAGYDGLISVDVTVNVASGGGGGSSAKWDDVTFIDYDGSVLYSYSLAEAQALTELPALPSHDSLVCQGWNWTLEAIKALNRPVTVGAMYITDDGATKLHIRIATVGRMTVPLYIGQTVANGVSIDWGDGSAAKTISGTGNVNTSHTYAEPGNYVISLMPQEGCTLSFSDGSSSYCVMGSTGNNSLVYCNMLQDVSIGKNVTSIGNNAFSYCYSLASITIPTGVTSIEQYVFQNCYSLSSITIPDSVTSMGSKTFQNCFSLSSITIPDGITDIANYGFSNCYSLSSITIPDSVNFVSSNAFYGCYSLASITIPDSVTSIEQYVFQNCFSLSSITIPDRVTLMGEYAFQNCKSLASITISDSVKYIKNYAFYGCNSLASITIPDSVTSIGNGAFNSCYGIRYYDFSACTDIPTLLNTKAFDSIPSDCQMLIPVALFDAWSTATNWATYASYMVAV